MAFVFGKNASLPLKKRHLAIVATFMLLFCASEAHSHAVVTDSDVKAAILPALYVEASIVEPLSFLAHRIALENPKDGKAFLTASNQPVWIKDYLRRKSSLQIYVGGGAADDVLSFLSQAFEHVPTNQFDLDALRDLVRVFAINHDESVQTFAKIFLARVDSPQASVESVAAIYAETRASQALFPDTKASLGSLVESHASAFKISADGYFHLMPPDQRLTPFGSYRALADQLTGGDGSDTRVLEVTVDQLQAMIDKAVKDSKTAPPDERTRTIANINAGTEIIGALLKLRDPQSAAVFRAVVVNEIKIMDAVTAMAAAGSLTVTGVGAIALAVVAIVSAMQPRGGDPEAAAIIKYQAQILAELRVLRSDVLALRLLVSELYNWLDRADVNDSISFQTIQNQISDLQDQLALGTQKLSEAVRQVILQGPRADYSTGVYFMTSASQRDLALSILEGSRSPGYVQYAAFLSRIAEFGLQTAKRTPMVDVSPWVGTGLRDINSALPESRVGDLAGLLSWIDPASVPGLSIDASVFTSRPNPIAWAWAVQMYVDLARWLPLSGGPDSGLLEFCSEAAAMAHMGADARKLIPILRHRYEDLSTQLANKLDNFLINQLKERLASQPRLRSALVDDGRDPFSTTSEDLAYLVSLDPNSLTSESSSTLSNDGRLVVQAYARGLVEVKANDLLDNVKMYHLFQNEATASLEKKGFVELVCGGSGCSYQGWSLDCARLETVAYLTAAGAALVGRAPGERLFPISIFGRCGLRSSLLGSTDFIRRTEADLRAYAHQYLTKTVGFEQLAFPKTDEDLRQKNKDILVNLIKIYDSQWELDVLRAYHLAAPIDSGSDIAQAAQLQESSRLAFDTVTRLGLAICKDDSTFQNRITNASDGNFATRLSTAGAISSIRDQIAKLKVAAIPLKDGAGNPLDLGSTIKACVRGPLGLEEVLRLLNSVSVAYSDRLPGGCSVP
jgi:hypothetical protein